MSFSIIAAIGKNRELGKNNQLIWHLPADLKFFQKITSGHAILMGRKTFDSLPKVLPGRKHYVLTKNDSILKSLESKGLGLKNSGTNTNNSAEAEDVIVVKDLANFIKQHENTPEEIFVIGGGLVYQQLIDHCKTLYLTEIEAEDSKAETFFPEFEKANFSREILETGEHDGIKYAFVRYDRKQ